MFSDIILNPVTLSVVLMVTLCLLKFNIILSVIIATLFAGFISGPTGHVPMPLSHTAAQYIETGIPGIMQSFVGMPASPAIINANSARTVANALVEEAYQLPYLVPPGGFADMNNIALAYILLGALAYALQASGLATKFANLLEKAFGRNGKIFLLILAVVASFSQNLIPIHIALVPILVPPLLIMMNKLKIDRRAAACSIAFGLKAPYILLPFGFGLVFQSIVRGQITAAGSPYGVDITDHSIWPYMIPLAGAMIVGLLIAIFVTYRKPREYDDLPLLVAPDIDPDDVTGKFKPKHWGALIGACATFGVQVWANMAFEGSPLWALSLGATLALIIMFFFGTLNPRRMKLNEAIKGGIGLMGFIAFIMLVASGYASVLRATGGIRTLVDASLYLAGDNRLAALIAMQLIGLLITMGIGTSFGTIPLIAAVFVPFLIGMGASIPAIVMTVAAAGVTGDAGMPQSDTALGPTAGLDADGQHDHIKDTCFPTFIHFNIPIKVFGVIAAMIMW